MIEKLSPAQQLTFFIHCCHIHCLKFEATRKYFSKVRVKVKILTNYYINKFYFTEKKIILGQH